MWPISVLMITPLILLSIENRKLILLLAEMSQGNLS